jgi:hypothetical protein
MCQDERVRLAKTIIVDDFLDAPDTVRNVALRQPFVKGHYAGVRTIENFLHLAPYREEFTRLIGHPLTDWDNGANGRFQCCFSSDAIPYHTDSQSMAGVLFLTPDAPIEAGLSFLRGRDTGLHRRSPDADLMMRTFGGGAEFDRARWEEIDRVGNRYNRLVLFDALVAHGASAYFGTTVRDGRLFQNFFFDLGSTDQL